MQDIRVVGGDLVEAAVDGAQDQHGYRSARIRVSLKLALNDLLGSVGKVSQTISLNPPPGGGKLFETSSLFARRIESLVVCCDTAHPP